MISTLFLAAANLVPLLGVVFWGWDAFEILVLYWLETAVIAFWTILQIGVGPAREAKLRSDRGHVLGGVGRAVFFTLHTGIFMAVHMMILWDLFAGSWAGRVHGPADFVRQLVIGNGLWIPLAILFIARGAGVLAEILSLVPRPAGERSVLQDLYGRIITMHLTVLLGAFAVNLFGGRYAPMLLIALKTGVDLFYNVFRARNRPERPVSKAGSAP